MTMQWPVYGRSHRRERGRLKTPQSVPTSSASPASLSPHPSLLATTTEPSILQRLLKNKYFRMVMVISPVVSGLVLLITFMVLGRSTAGAIPKPNNFNIFYEVSMSSVVITDNTRKVMTTLFFPIPKDSCSSIQPRSYFLGDAAKVSSAQFFNYERQNVFETLTLSACTATKSLVTNADHPLIILEPNINTTRHLYSALAQEWAAGGYAVITIDHPGDANAVETTGPYSPNQFGNAAQIDPFTPTRDWNSVVQNIHDARISDISYVIDSLSVPANLQGLLDLGGSGLKLKSSFDLNNLAVVGHGFGGAVATSLAATDPRFKLSINLGGTAKIDKDTKNNVIFFGRQGASRLDDAFWPTSWKHLRGIATEYDLQGAGMFDYSDLPLITKVSETGMAKSKVKGLGQIDAQKAFDITKNFVRAYLDIQFGREPDRATFLYTQVRMNPEMRPYSPSDNVTATLL